MAALAPKAARIAELKAQVAARSDALRARPVADAMSATGQLFHRPMTGGRVPSTRYSTNDFVL
ncbi:hypothetical protein [Myxococcus sp. CA018]|uniref:hypothetical protein n=1 Tax=Myxococcus sp. CA018 TaxID=2651864 RepID=UPI0011431FA4|nr:hypothetical protein [Myxococcus sp. CA018]